MAAAASSSSAAAAAVADLPQPQAMSSSSHGRPTRPQQLLPFLISEVARSVAIIGALLAQIASGPLTQQQKLLHHSKETIESTLLQRLAAKGLKDIITLSPDLTSLDVLLRLAYFIDNSGEWSATVPIIRVAKHQGRVKRLPIELVSADVEGVGSRAVYDSRCEALRQISLIGRQIGPLVRRVNGAELLGGRPLTIRTRQTLPADHPFRDRYDEANPVCQEDGEEFASIRDIVLYRMDHGGWEVANKMVYQFDDPQRCERLRVLASQPPPIWDCRSTSTSTSSRWVARSFYRMILLHGDQPDHTFEAHVIICSSDADAPADVSLHTTERPVDGKEGAAALPETVRVVRDVMGADAQVAFGNWLDVALPPAAGAGAGDQGGEQTSGSAMGYPSQHTGGDLMDIDSGGGPAFSAGWQGGGAGGGGSSRDLLQKIRSMRSVASQLVSDLDGAERMIASQADSTLDGASAGSLSALLETLTKQLAEIADHDPQVPISVPLVSAGVSSSSAAPAAAASAGGGGGGADGNRGGKRKAAASSASTCLDGGEGDMAADDRRAVRRRRKQTAEGADGGSVMGEQ
ncbi:unnamed protein product [Vitrella brassicaformis CCMP3155]|uniref:Uncharacterized protein n=2 Tax=Vitrella brassicaformis TaxID=1169539 RepID=A0A0G4H5D9_VITBC|nr:unnamed protein product [Vitrella brassicaformis CCMP3155]|eukprot:CEM38983.1 unnamed protein product [Vitrella brassicaformis CCMP3155]